MSWSGSRGPAYRITTERLTIRCWSPHDAEVLARAVEANLDHLAPWMPWVKEEPLSLDERVARLLRFRGQFDLGVDFLYAVFDRDEGALLGGSGLHPRVGPRAFEIGYWIDRGHTGRGLASEAAGALTKVAFELGGVDRIEIRCLPSNLASARVAQKLGFHHEATLRRRVLDGEDRLADSMVWSLFASDYRTSAAAMVAVNAYDAADRALL